LARSRPISKVEILLFVVEGLEELGQAVALGLDEGGLLCT
jgi:hypothetical protein